jgi:hypothetical protein
MEDRFGIDQLPSGQIRKLDHRRAHPTPKASPSPQSCQMIPSLYPYDDGIVISKGIINQMIFTIPVLIAIFIAIVALIFVL